MSMSPQCRPQEPPVAGPGPEAADGHLSDGLVLETLNLHAGAINTALTRLHALEEQFKGLSEKRVSAPSGREPALSSAANPDLARTHTHLVSLGFSCLTRFSIELCSADFLRLPFDFLISSKAFILDAFASDGANFLISPEQATLYEQTVQRLCGVSANGAVFWHDFPRQDATRLLLPGWEEHVERVNQKYAALWRRFAAFLRDAQIEKRIVISNAQKNLVEFASSPGEFESKFGLDENFFKQLYSALRAFGARSFRISFLDRTIESALRLHLLRREYKDVLDVRFVGVMNLSTEARIAMSSLAIVPPHADSVESICGRYSDGREIVNLGDGAALVCRQNDGARVPIGEARPYPNGFIFIFTGQPDNVQIARLDRDGLTFANRERWPKAATPI